MSKNTTNDLVQRVEALLRPGDIDLAGIIVDTPYSQAEEVEMHEATLEVGEMVATHAGGEEWYVYSGNDSPEFGANQHQGLTLADDAFIWECQQLVRNGTFDIVMYFESSIDREALLADLQDADYRVTWVETDIT